MRTRTQILPATARVAAACLLLALSLSCGGGSTNGALANKNGISGTGDVTALSKAVRIKDFSLAHESYGSGTGGGFVLNTLSPVFRIETEDASGSGLEDRLDVHFEKADTGASATLSDLRSNLRIVEKGDGRTFYLVVFKTQSAALLSRELSPGSLYRYGISSKDGTELYFQGNRLEEIRGEMRTKPITFTYPIGRESEDSMVNLGAAGLGGIGSLTPAFIVNARHPLGSYDPTRPENGFGLFDDMTVFVNGRRIDASRLDDVQFDEVGSTAFKLLIQPGAGLNWHGAYTLYIRVSPTLTMSVDSRPVEVKQDDLPKYIEFHTKPR